MMMVMAMLNVELNRSVYLFIIIEFMSKLGL